VLPAAESAAAAELAGTGVVMTTVPEVTVVATLDCDVAAAEAADEAMALALAAL
jgi:purine nucleoside phosphorylase